MIVLAIITNHIAKDIASVQMYIHQRIECNTCRQTTAVGKPEPLQRFTLPHHTDIGLSQSLLTYEPHDAQRMQ